MSRDTFAKPYPGRYAVIAHARAVLEEVERPRAPRLLRRDRHLSCAGRRARSGTTTCPRSSGPPGRSRSGRNGISARRAALPTYSTPFLVDLGEPLVGVAAFARDAPARLFAAPTTRAAASDVAIALDARARAGRRACRRAPARWRRRRSKSLARCEVCAVKDRARRVRAAARCCKFSLRMFVHPAPLVFTVLLRRAPSRFDATPPWPLGRSISSTTFSASRLRIADAAPRARRRGRAPPPCSAARPAASIARASARSAPRRRVADAMPAASAVTHAGTQWSPCSG